MIKGIIFDMDGTVIDTNELVINCIQESVRTHLGYLPETSEFVSILGKPLSVQMAFFSEDKRDLMVETYRKLYRSRRDAQTRLFHGLDRLLQQLDEKGIRMAVLTNKGSSGTWHALEKFHIEKFFDPVITVDDVINRKPHPEGALNVLESWGVDKTEILLIGDSANDILCANQAGIPAVLVGWTILPPSQFADLRIDHRVETTEDLLELIRSYR